MVDTPVGKKCRDCAANRTHLQESKPQQVALGFLAAVATAFAGGVILHSGLGYILILAFPYGALIGEAALRAGQHRRSWAMQVMTGVGAALGSSVGAMVNLIPGAVPGESGIWVFSPLSALHPMTLVVTGIAVVIAVSRVRYL